jgi:hypothetical protein
MNYSNLYLLDPQMEAAKVGLIDRGLVDGRPNLRCFHVSINFSPLLLFLSIAILCQQKVL